MAKLLYEQDFLPSGCHMTLLEIGTDIGGIPAGPEPMPPVRVGTGGVAVLTRCEDDGRVDLNIWAGEPGPAPPGWQVVFDGKIKTEARGFEAGTATASAFHIDAAPGTYRVRVEARRDAHGDVDGVRFVFPGAPDLEGKVLFA